MAVVLVLLGTGFKAFAADSVSVNQSIRKAIGVIVFDKELDEEAQEGIETLCDMKWQKCYDDCEEEFWTEDGDWSGFVDCSAECQEDYDFCLESAGPAVMR